MKSIIFLLLGSTIYFLAGIPNVNALTCTCWDPATQESTGETFVLPPGINDCNTFCSADCRLQSPDLRCFLCAPEGGVDCGGSGGGGGGGGACPFISFTVEGILRSLSCNLNRIIPFLVLVATALFLWGVVGYLTAGGDENRLQEARRLIIYGIISLTVIIAVWGFVYIVIDFTFGTKTIPNIPGGGVVNPI